eukprot:9685774-Alexandrium_andersonii.AAC.1
MAGPVPRAPGSGSTGSLRNWIAQLPDAGRQGGARPSDDGRVAGRPTSSWKVQLRGARRRDPPGTGVPTRPAYRN